MDAKRRVFVPSVENLEAHAQCLELGSTRRLLCAHRVLWNHRAGQQKDAGATWDCFWQSPPAFGVCLQGSRRLPQQPARCLARPVQTQDARAISRHNWRWSPTLVSPNLSGTRLQEARPTPVARLTRRHRPPLRTPSVRPPLLQCGRRLPNSRSIASHPSNLHRLIAQHDRLVGTPDVRISCLPVPSSMSCTRLYPSE
jgi:hypothetical protein